MISKMTITGLAGLAAAFLIGAFGFIVGAVWIGSRASASALNIAFFIFFSFSLLFARRAEAVTP